MRNPTPFTLFVGTTDPIGWILPALPACSEEQSVEKLEVAEMLMHLEVFDLGERCKRIRELIDFKGTTDFVVIGDSDSDV